MMQISQLDIISLSTIIPRLLPSQEVSASMSRIFLYLNAITVIQKSSKNLHAAYFTLWSTDVNVHYLAMLLKWRDNRIFNFLLWNEINMEYFLLSDAVLNFPSTFFSTNKIVYQFNNSTLLIPKCKENRHTLRNIFRIINVRLELLAIIRVTWGGWEPLGADLNYWFVMIIPSWWRLVLKTETSRIRTYVFIKVFLFVCESRQSSYC